MVWVEFVTISVVFKEKLALKEWGTTMLKRTSENIAMCTQLQCCPSVPVASAHSKSLKYVTIVTRVILFSIKYQL